jgi:mono/diheme cytochrome c family protein
MMRLDGRGAMPGLPIGAVMRRISLLTIVVASVAGLPLAALGETPVERGLYLVTLSGCNDCHTPGGLLGNPDKGRLLGGSDVGFGDPSSGVWVGPNLTPDKETGIGSWTSDEIVTAITKGERPDGRILSEIMPWPALAHLTSEDALAIAAYLKSLPAVKNTVAGPFGPGQTPTAPVSVILPVSVYAKLPNPLPSK